MKTINQILDQINELPELSENLKSVKQKLTSLKQKNNGLIKVKNSDKIISAIDICKSRQRLSGKNIKVEIIIN